MRKIAVFSAFMLTLFMFGCDARPSKSSTDNAKNIANNLTYVQDSRTGICYAVVEFAHPGEVSSNSSGVTAVPCEKIPANLLVK